MPVDKLKPNDPRVQSATANLRGRTYHYLHGKPSGTIKGTVLLVHGWPDLSFGWRHQVPLLLSLGLEVIVPDCLGYGGTDAPQDLALYSLKSVCDDFAELVRQICGPDGQIILGGHDWGGMLVWRFALWHPELLKGVFSICTPYVPPSPVFIDIPDMIKRLPNFSYQAQLAGPDVEREIGSDPDKIRGWLKGMYGAQGPAGEHVFSVEKGVFFENIDKMGDCPLLNAEEVDFYVQQYARNGVRGPLNWYRTRKINYEEELALLKDGQQPKIKIPSLMVTAAQDAALLPSMAAGMDAFFENLTKASVDGTHWALWAPWAEQTNGKIEKFVQDLLSGSAKASI
ncbi:alpha/beta-hydrolase [Cryphonectria parasitica EP155]|uniref:Alpha/beta-hydrolase n=1 Tax=Cryphonectria parasitica (strain ATCC 38755 / EP155) TaxID=660469 RepID=A0A9P5CV26_CRYP1|nr:alpha/beta-hydrolase [Cryphonectria parasitica EP155]KAF3770480.1 alpha/beta-hydrolase [Cryphonectria parasitica EP155]